MDEFNRRLFISFVVLFCCCAFFAHSRTFACFCGVGFGIGTVIVCSYYMEAIRDKLRENGGQYRKNKVRSKINRKGRAVKNHTTNCHDNEEKEDAEAFSEDSHAKKNTCSRELRTIIRNNCAARFDYASTTDHGGGDELQTVYEEEAESDVTPSAHLPPGDGCYQEATTPSTHLPDGYCCPQETQAQEKKSYGDSDSTNKSRSSDQGYVNHQHHTDNEAEYNSTENLTGDTSGALLQVYDCRTTQPLRGTLGAGGERSYCAVSRQRTCRSLSASPKTEPRRLRVSSESSTQTTSLPSSATTPLSSDVEQLLDDIGREIGNVGVDLACLGRWLQVFAGRLEENETRLADMECRLDELRTCLSEFSCKTPRHIPDKSIHGILSPKYQALLREAFGSEDIGAIYGISSPD